METGMFEMEEIERLAALIHREKLSRIKLEYGDCCLTIEGERPQPTAMPQMMMAPSAANAPQPAPAAAPAASAAKEPPKAGTVIKSPLVGTYYNAPSPDSEPFVQVGQRVSKGDVLMIVESMKLMNEVQSELDGVVAEIYVKNGDPVEFDQPVLRFE